MSLSTCPLTASRSADCSTLRGCGQKSRSHRSLSSCMERPADECMTTSLCYYTQLTKIYYLLARFRCPSDILFTSYWFTRCRAWPGNHLIRCVADLIRASRAIDSSVTHKSAITDQVVEENHVIDWDKAKVVDRESQRQTRWIKEALWIRKTPTSCNLDPWPEPESWSFHVPLVICIRVGIIVVKYRVQKISNVQIDGRIEVENSLLLTLVSEDKS